MYWKLLFILLVFPQCMKAQFETYLYLNPADCFSCMPKLKQANKHLLENQATIVTRNLSEKDLRLTKEKFDFLSDLTYRKLEDIGLLGLDEKNLVISSLIFAKNNQVFLVKTLREIGSLPAFFQRAPAFVPGSRNIVWHGSEELSSRTRLNYLSDRRLFLIDYLTGKEYELNLDVKRLKELSFNARQIYQGIEKKTEYQSLKEHYAKLEDYDIDTVRIESSQVVGKYQYTFLVVPDVKEIQGQLVVGWLYVMARRDLEDGTTRFFNVNEKGLNKLYETTSPILNVENEKYLLPVEKDSNFKDNDAFIGLFCEEGNELKFKRSLKITLPSGFESTKHEFQNFGIKRCDGYLAFEHHPSVFSLAENSYIDLPPNPNTFNKGKVEVYNYVLYDLTREKDEIFFFYKEKGRYFLCSINESGIPKTKEIDESGIVSACFGEGFLYILNKDGKLVQRTFLNETGPNPMDN